jgi:hypothetical protein
MAIEDAALARATPQAEVRRMRKLGASLREIVEETSLGLQTAVRARPWRSLAIIGAGFGAGAVITLMLVVGIWAWYQSLPTPWNESALVSSEATGVLSSPSSSARDPKFAGISLTYALQNNTAQDITLAENVVIMERLAKGNTLVLEQIGFAKPYSSYFIPAHQRAEFSMKLDVDCSPPPRGDYCQGHPGCRLLRCFNDNFGSADGFDGFVLFDQSQRLEVFLPRPGY